MAERIFKIVFSSDKIENGVFTYINHVDPTSKYSNKVNQEDVLERIRSRFSLNELVIKEIKRLK